MKKKQVIIRADGNKEIGYGHVFRCLALAQMLNNDFECWFYIQKPEPFLKAEIKKVVHGLKELPNESDFGYEARQLTQHTLKGDEIVVLDGYQFDLSYQIAIKANGNPLVFIDDLIEQHFVADMVINHAADVQIADYSTEFYTKLLLGPEYALIRRAFLNVAKDDKKVKQIKNIFISMGGTVQTGLIEQVVTGCSQLTNLEQVNILGGDQESNKQILGNKLAADIQWRSYTGLDEYGILNLMKQSDLAVCPASTLSYEAAAVGTGMIAGYTYKNQLNLYQGMVENGIGVAMNCLTEISSSDWNKVFMSMNVELINYQIIKQRQFIDGQSGVRIKNTFSEFAESC